MRYFLIFALFTNYGALIGGSQENYYAMSDEYFFSLPKSQQTISLSEPDTTFLDAAIFQATNEARRKNGLQIFRYDICLYKASSNHASSMVIKNFYNHINPYSPFEKTVDKRVELYTKRFVRLGENIGKYQPLISNEWLIIHWNRKTEQYEFLDPDSHLICQPYTYAAYARYVVNQWMTSSSHRINILNDKYTYMGCAGRLSSNPYKARWVPFGIFVQNFGGEK